MLCNWRDQSLVQYYDSRYREERVGRPVLIKKSLIRNKFLYFVFWEKKVN